jgi:hypothetical protein
MKYLLSLFLIILSITTFAQDKIIKNTGDTINCKITELGATQVKYYYSDNPKLVFGIDKALVKKVKFATGEIIAMDKNSFNNDEYYANQSKHAIKVNFLSPLTGSLELTYEQNIKPGRSWETSLGIIGAGIDVMDVSPFGFYGKFAYKFIKSPDYYIQTMHYSHILKGGYIAPEIALRYFTYDKHDYYYYGDYNNTSQERTDNFSFAIMLKLGKQWVFNGAFIVDLYFGVGYGLSANNHYDTFTYGFIAGDEEFPMSGTAGIRIGWGF